MMARVLYRPTRAPNVVVIPVLGVALLFTKRAEFHLDWWLLLDEDLPVSKR